MNSVFLCHSSRDKGFVRRLYYAFRDHGVQAWLDEAEIQIGESLIDAIGDAIARMDYFVIVLSPNSVSSEWVTHELRLAMARQLSKRNITVLPVLYKECARPNYLLGIKYADFTEGRSFGDVFRELLRVVCPDHDAAMSAERASRDGDSGYEQGYALRIPLSTGRASFSDPIVQANLERTDTFFRLRNIKLTLNQGEIVGIAGLSGSGKQTLAETLAGRSKYQGEIRFPSHDVCYRDWNPKRDGRFDKQIVGFATLGPLYRSKKYRRKSIRSYLRQDTRGPLADDAIEIALRQSGLWDMVKDRLAERIDSLAPGQHTMLVISLALVYQPSLLILDACLDSVVPHARENLLSRLLEMNANGTTLVITSDEFSHLAPWCDRVVVMGSPMLLGDGSSSHDSTILADATPKDLVQNEKTRWLLSIDGRLIAM